MGDLNQNKTTGGGSPSSNRPINLLPRLLFAAVFVLSFLKSIGVNIVDILAPNLSAFVGDKNNSVNQIFVKFGWGWTVTVTLTNALVLQVVSGRIQWKWLLGLFVQLLMSTAVWWILTSLFEVIEGLTVSCSNPNITDVVECRQHNFTWEGFDISGHTFLLMFSILVLVQELPDVSEYPSVDCHFWRVSLISLTSFFICALIALWIVMLLVTSLYYHVFWHKIVGALFAWSGWLFVYSLAERLCFYTDLN